MSVGRVSPSRRLRIWLDLTDVTVTMRSFVPFTVNFPRRLITQTADGVLASAGITQRRNKNARVLSSPSL